MARQAAVIFAERQYHLFSHSTKLNNYLSKLYKGQNTEIKLNKK